jgi:outer membrane immunogenic protein
MKKILLGALAFLALGAIPAIAADLPARYTKAPPIVAPVYNWTGFYVGVNAGGEWGQSDPRTTTVFSPFGYFASSSVDTIAVAGMQRINHSGFTGGLTAGYNWQASNFVFGIESDFNYFGVRGSTSSGPVVYPCCVFSNFTIQSSVSSDWLITVRPRIGVLVTPALLLYGTGGLAVANVKGNFLFTDTFATAAESATISSTRVGWTAGAGGEYALMNGWSVKGEYLYVDLGRASTTSTNLTAFGPPPFPFPVNVFTHSINLRSNIVRVGLNYKFGGPVVAKY